MTDRPQPMMDEHGVGMGSSKCPHYTRAGACAICADVQCCRYDRACLPWVRGMVEWGGRNHDRLMQLAGELGVTRARLRKVQRGARRAMAYVEGIDGETRYWPVYPDDYPERLKCVEACEHCYRALPKSGECRCGGEE